MGAAYPELYARETLIKETIEIETGCTSCALVCPDACIEVYRAAGRE